MIKTVEIGDKEVRLDNNIGWTLIYRDQFGHDILPSLMPMLAGAVDVVSGLVQEVGDKGEVSIETLAEMASGDAFMNAMIHIGGFEFVDFINITWALAKNADETIPEPKKWVRELGDGFTVDTVGLEVVKLVFSGMVSSKNLNRLSDLLKAVQPKKTESTSTRSSSQESKED